MLLFHGTCHPFSAFQATGPGPAASLEGDVGVYSHSRALGTFFSGHPRTAAHFTLRPEVLDAGFDSDEGSASLCYDPWQFDPAPFEPSAELLICQAPEGARWHEVPLMRWMEMVAEEGPTFFDRLRADLSAQGFDGVIIPAWDGRSASADYGQPCVEYFAPTYVLFDASGVSIEHRCPAEEAWNLCPEAVPGEPLPLVRLPEASASDNPPRPRGPRIR